MSFTLSNYLNNIPAGSPEYPLAQSILSKITAAASTANAQGALAAKQEISSLLGQLFNSLVDNRRITPATVLALVAAAAATGGRSISDIGVLGNVGVSGSAITLTAGSY